MTGSSRPKQLRRQVPARRRSHKPAARARVRFSVRVRIAWAALAVVVLSLGAAAIVRQTAPVSNTSASRFDAIIVLGTSADKDGNPTPDLLSRVTEGVREYERGVAPRLILTGGAAHGQFVEASVMSRTAQALGVPAAAILVEPKALDTIQNACYSTRILQQHGWRSAEVVSDASHLPRAGLIFNKLPIDWSAHAAPRLQPESVAYQQARSAVETLKTLRYLIWSRWVDTCEP